MDALENQTLALAGMFQSAALIEQMAYKGEISQAAFDCCVDSLFAFDAETTLDVFGDISGLTRGLKALSQHLGGHSRDSGKNLAYYIMSMMKVSSKILRDNTLTEKIQSELQTIQQQSIDFELSRTNQVMKIDGLYQQTISNIQPRIIVRGEQSFLANSDSAGKVRTLLLAGIRSAVLWHQLGGSKWKLVFARKKFVDCSKRLLSNF